MTLDEQMDELLNGPLEVVDDDECPLFLEMSDETAAALVEGLRCALYGGTMAPLARRALLVTLDAITGALTTRSTIDQQAARSTI